MRGTPIALFLLALLVVQGIAQPVPAQTEPVTGEIVGPEAAAPSTAVQYNLTVAGGPGAVDGNFSMKYYIEGGDLTGGIPTKTAPRTEFGRNTTYVLSITAPIREQTIAVVAEINSTNGTTWQTVTVRREVDIVTPVVLAATFRNDGSVAAVNFTAEFYVDGKLVGTKRVARLNPRVNATVTLTWFPIGLVPGEHRVTVTADLNGDGVIDPSRGEVTTSNLFYKKQPDLPVGSAALIGILLFLTAAAVLAVIKRRRKRR